jgi:hypothetical protein
VTERFANNAATTLDTTIDADDTSVIVDDASLFPTAGNFRIRIDDEIMLVTAVAGATFTVTRAQESTSGASHTSGATVRHVLTAAALSVAIGALIGIACSDETTAIVAAAGKATFRMPYAMTVTEVRASLTTAAASGTFTVDINESGTTILSTKLTIDATEKTSETAAAAAVISDSALADDAEITIDVDDDASGDAKGLKVWLIGTRA